MDTTELTPAVLSILRLAAEKIRSSPGLARGSMLLSTKDGLCYCMLGAVYASARELNVSSIAAAAEWTARTELRKTLYEAFNLTMSIAVYNDYVLLQGLPFMSVSSEAKAPAIAIFTQTIERLESSS